MMIDDDRELGHAGLVLSLQSSLSCPSLLAYQHDSFDNNVVLHD